MQGISTYWFPNKLTCSPILIVQVWGLIVWRRKKDCWRVTQDGTRPCKFLRNNAVPLTQQQTEKGLKHRFRNILRVEKQVVRSGDSKIMTRDGSSFFFFSRKNRDGLSLPITNTVRLDK